MIRLFKKRGSDLLSHREAVPSALKGLTSLFGMVRGGPLRYSHQFILYILKVKRKEEESKKSCKNAEFEN